MKNKKIIFGLSLLLILNLTTCKGGFVKSVNIKAKPTLRINLGEKEIKLKDYFSAKTIDKNVSDAEFKQSFGIFNYSKTKDDDIMRLLFYYPITDLDLDISENLDELKKIEESLTKIIENRNFIVPKLSKTETKNIPLNDLNDKILEAFNSPPPIKTNLINISLLNPPPEGISLPSPPPINITLGSFTTASFGSGANLKFDIKSDGAETKITKLTLKDVGNNKTIGEWTDSKPNPPQISLANKTISNRLQITFEAKISNKTKNSLQLNIKPTFSGKITKATGINIATIENNIPEIKMPIDTGGDNKFYSAKIAEGNIKLAIKFPTNWEGFTTKYALNINQPSGLNIKLENETTSLANKTINSQDITASGKIQIKATDATYIAESEPKFEFKIGVTKFAHIKAKMPDDFKTTFNNDIPMSEDIKKWVKEIKFTDLNIKITLHNGLPVGNDINLQVKSATLNNLDETKTFMSGKKSEQDITPANFIIRPQDPEFSKIDFTTKIFFANTQTPEEKEQNIITINNLVPGQSVNFNGKVEITPNWETAIINPGNEGKFTGQYPKEITELLDIQNLNKYKNQGLQFSTTDPLKVYLYANSTLFEDSSKYNMTAKVFFSHGSLPNSLSPTGKNIIERDDPYFLMGSVEERKPVSFSKPLPPEFAREKGLLDIEKSYTGSLPTPSIKKELSEFFNKYPEKIKLHYDFQVDEVNIKKTDIDKLNKNNDTKAKIKIDLLLEFPFQFNINNPNEKGLNLINIAKKNDLLGRKEQKEELKKWIDQVDSVFLNVDYINTLGIKVDAFVTEPTTAINKFNRKIELKPGTNNLCIKISQEEIKHIQETVPFELDIKAYLPNGSYTVKKDAGIRAKLYFTSKLDINETFGNK